ncbi:MAG: hypothetical protein ACI9KN_002037, partial [Gammaproteobacteria bacterium]
KGSFPNGTYPGRIKANENMSLRWSEATAAILLSIK